MTENLFGVIPSFVTVSSISVALPYTLSRQRRNINKKIWVGLDINGLLFLSNFNHVWIRSTDLSKNHQFKVSKNALPMGKEFLMSTDT